MHRPERLYSVNDKRVGVHGGIPLYTDVIKGLVFDMDGLLFDSERVVRQSGIMREICWVLGIWANIFTTRSE